ncbi:MAG: hypothetical protein AB7O24_13730 [Kofleriaceae bacterium]
MSKTPETIETISLDNLDDVNGGRGCNRNGRAAYSPYGFNPFDKRSVQNFVRDQQRMARRGGYGNSAAFGYGYRGYYGGWGWPRYYR